MEATWTRAVALGASVVASNCLIGIWSHEVIIEGLYRVLSSLKMPLSAELA